MSTADEPPNAGSEGIPEGVPDPPAILPTPDKFGTDHPEEKKQKKGKKRKNKNRGRKHPTDQYEPLNNNRKGCKGCCGCFAMLGVITLLAIGGLAYWLVGPVIGYERVTFSEATSTISEAPEKPTVYIGKNITYAAPPTEVEIAIIASNEVTVSGDFLENVKIISRNVTAQKGARFAKDLDVKAAKFVDEGIILKGELTGAILPKGN